MIASPPPFQYQDPFPLGADYTDYELLTRDGVALREFRGHSFVQVEPETLTLLARTAFRDCAFLLRPSHLEQVAGILDDPQASANDRHVALTLLRNADIAARGVLPLCQDTGTATVIAKKGQQIWTGGDDAEAIARGIYETYVHENLRYSQTVPLDLYREVNSGTNLPAQIDISATGGCGYHFLFLAKGGGSANKTALLQETKAVLNPTDLEHLLAERMLALGTAACPPYHVAFVIGGLSAEACLKVVKVASAKALDTLPEEGNALGRAFRDRRMERRLLEIARASGIGAQFGGRHFALDVRVIRLPRHGASCPIGMAVSCSADRNIKARIDRNGVWIERLEREPGRLIPPHLREPGADADAVAIDLRRPMAEIRATLSRLPVSTRLSLSGPIIVARDIAHAKLKERLDAGGGLPDYFKNHPVYYAGPAKTPAGLPSGSFGPTTAGRMDSYVDLFQSHGASLVMLAKGNRSSEVTAACQRHGGFYLGSIGGPAAVLAQENIRRVECVEFPELGMEAVYRIEVEDFPAFLLVDDKGNDFFRQIQSEACAACLRKS